MITVSFYTEGLQSELESNGVILYNVDGEWESNDPVKAQQIIDSYDTVSELRTTAKKRIAEQAQAIMMQLEDAYPSFEKQTWPYQRADVEAYIADNNAPTPTIDAIAIGGGVTREEQLQRTINKTQQYAALSTKIVGLKQKYERYIEDSNDLIYLSKVNFEAS